MFTFQKPVKTWPHVDLLKMLLICQLLVAGCTYSGHSIKAEVGREVGESLKGSVYKVGCEVQFKARANQ